MAFTYDNIENIAKATGLTEDELASLIIAKENEGWTNAEIAEWFAANRDADKQRRASEREAIANSVTDWRDSHPEQWRVGMVNSIFGDNSMLSQYYAAENAAKESEKNRQSQSEYNQYLKEYDRANAEREEAIRKADEKRQRDAEKAALYKQYNEAEGAAEKAAIQKRIDVLEGSDDTQDDYVKDEMLAAYDKDKLAKEYAAEDENWREKQALKETSKLQRLADAATKKVSKDQIAQSVYNRELYPNLSDDERNKLYADIMGVKTIGEQVKNAQQSAIASKAGEKTGKAIDEADLKKKANDAIKNNISPARLTQEERDKIREMNYTWTTNGWSKR
jgi:hypothetical protein